MLLLLGLLGLLLLPEVVLHLEDGPIGLLYVGHLRDLNGERGRAQIQRGVFLRLTVEEGLLLLWLRRRLLLAAGRGEEVLAGDGGARRGRQRILERILQPLGD